MIDRNHLDQAGLGALGWLEETERADFDHECLVNPELRAIRADARDLIAAVAATAPPATPPPQALARIYARLSVPEIVARRAPPRPWLHRFATRGMPWAAAAGFALLAAWMSWRSHQRVVHWRQLLESHHPERTSDSAPTSHEPGPPGLDPTATGKARPGDLTSPRPSGQGNLPPRYFTNRPGDPEVRLQQDTERLRTEVAKLRAAENARQQLPAGISDLRVVEMLPPGAQKSPEKKDLLTSRVTEALAAGLSSPAPAAPDPAPSSPPTEPLRLRGQGSNPAEDIVIDSGLVNIGTLNLHPDAQVVHRNFPRPEEYARLGLTPLDAQTVYDGQGGLWHRSGNGTEWIGQKVPPNWTPPDADEGASGPAPPLRQAPTAAKAPAATESTPSDTGAASGVPYALPVLDQQGRGTLIVRNLPPAPTGEFYHLWMMDPRFSGPVSVGVLPPMESAYDHFGFDLGTPGFVPTGYLLTLEKAGPAAAPSGKVVLQGP